MMILLSLSLVANASTALKDVEAKYRKAPSIKMDVDKLIKLKLLEREKHSEGEIKVKTGGRLRWETTKPDHSLVVINSKAVWLVDFPAEEDEKVAVLKAQNPKKSQPHALVAFLLGRGHISDDFKVVSEKVTDDQRTLTLRPKGKEVQVKTLELLINKKTLIIDRISFEDPIGNTTILNFKNVRFGEEIGDSEFEFTPPKGSDVTLVD